MLDDATAEQLMSSLWMMRLNLTTTQRRDTSKATFLERDEVLIINKTKQKLETGGASGLNVGSNAEPLGYSTLG